MWWVSERVEAFESAASKRIGYEVSGLPAVPPADDGKSGPSKAAENR